MGAYVTGGDGYITYKVESDKSRSFNSCKVEFSAFLGHKGIVHYIGRDKTNVTISYSFDNRDFVEVYNLYDSIDKLTEGQEYQREVDLSSYAVDKDILYVRINLLHLAYSDFPVDWIVDKTFVNHEKKTILLQRLGVKLFNVKITATQK